MKKCTIYTIGKTTITKEYDDFSDYDYYGKYTNDIGPGVYVRSEHDFYERLPAEMERDSDGTFIGKGVPEYRTYNMEYSGIIPANHIPHNPKSWAHVTRKEKSKVIKKYGSLKNADYAYAIEDCKRLEKLGDTWSYIVVSVKTVITTDTGMHDTICNSLCGIESDSGKECFEEIVRDLKSMNKDDLLKMGFSEKEIDDSLNNAIEKEDW